MGTNNRGANSFLRFPIEFFGVETNTTNLLGIFGVIFNKIFHPLRTYICNMQLKLLTHPGFCAIFANVQNCLARIVAQSPPFTCSVPLLCLLHWLQVKFRIAFTISLFTAKLFVKNSRAPSLWNDLPLTVCSGLQSISRRFSLTWPFPNRHEHAWWPVDVTELLYRFCVQQ